MKDSKQRLIKIGASVDVPEPIDGDMHCNEFTGHVVTFRDGNVIVQDQENMFFEIEPERLTINAEEGVQVSPEEIRRVIIEWIADSDCDTLLRIYNENFDEPITYDQEKYEFNVPIEEADRVGMEYAGNADYVN